MESINEIISDDAQLIPSPDIRVQRPDEAGEDEVVDAQDNASAADMGMDETESDLSWDDLADDVQLQQEDCEGGCHPENAEEDLVMRLAGLSLKHNLTHACLNDIAALLRSCGHNVPKDARTILGTERRAPVEQDGTFIHFGLRKGILDAVQVGIPPNEIKLQVSIDGLPLYKSSSTCFWPIVCMIMNHGTQEPFLASIYCGTGKPPNLDAFLAPFVEEMQTLSTDGVLIKGRFVTVVLQAVICDAVARSFLKCIKSHNGYYGCERCTQKGTHRESRLLFLDLDADLHTNQSFRQQICQGHHTGHSPFLHLDIDIISAFPLDYMHLLCLGVMRRLLHIWLGGRYGRGKLSTDQQRILSGRLNSLRTDFPCTFQRKPRGIDEVERWKATEFRTFLLYAGPVALKKLLPDNFYNHFLVLHVATRILATPSIHRTQNEYANELLRYFVQEMGELYGTAHIVYNVHSLIHLAGDCLRHGPLDAFSAFPFESYLGKLKRMLRTTNSPLSQLSRRISEYRSSSTSVTERSTVHIPKPGFFYLLESGSVARVNELHASHVRVTVFSSPRDFFVSPLRSSLLNIFRVGNGNSPSEHTIPLCTFTKEKHCVLLRYKSEYVALPVLHHQ